MMLKVRRRRIKTSIPTLCFSPYGKRPSRQIIIRVESAGQSLIKSICFFGLGLKEIRSIKAH